MESKADQEDTPNESKEEEFQPKSEKEKQIRDSIMNDLYNDLSSSDEEEESPTPVKTAPDGKGEEEKVATTEEVKNAEENESKESIVKKKSSSSKSKGYTKEQMLKDAQDMEKKKIAKEANEALRELYGEDYEEPRNPLDSQNEASKNNLTGKVKERLGAWFSQAKDKYNSEMSNPQSKLSTTSSTVSHPSPYSN